MTDEQSGGDESAATDEALLRRWLVDHDADCPRCDYNLRGQQNAACPECGLKIGLMVASRESYLARWLISLIATTLPAGVGVLITLVLLREGLQVFEHQSEFESVIMICFLAAPPIVGALVIWRRKFLRWPEKVQKIAMLACVSLTLVIFALFILSSA